MRIAQVAPLMESVPPRGYGGTERVVSWLTEELVARGHDVVLFASGDSVTTAELVPCAPRSLRTAPDGMVEPVAPHMLMLDVVFRRCHEFDVVHFHFDYLHFPLSARHCPMNLSTLHGRLDIPNLYACFRRFPSLPLVSISHAQRAPMPFANFVATVHHGMPRERFVASDESRGYLVFLGRISPEKRCDRAIEIATRAGRELFIAAKVDDNDREYFTAIIEPMLARPGITFLGEVGDDDKALLLAGADALLFPIDWPEPFGLVMIEALACGTPVIAWPNGSVPEVIDDGVSGFLVRSLGDAVDAVERLSSLSRRRCREIFERRFSVERMARDYVDVYRALARRREARDDVVIRAAEQAHKTSDRTEPGPPRH